MAARPGPNKLSINARDALWKVFHDIGGTQRMAQWADDNPGDFYKLFQRLVPTQVTGEDGGPVTLTIGWKNSE